ncbi:ABC transporter permease [Halanaerobium sp. MA284_MarDTE_T2]|uniref:ABC transporter permease n=1 Tax=Halanaerobium sp. MA284_MarDTE_T2 TaxID=2183913 RepID=UPI000DF119DD|nr:ABC transporter permease [Halanaerobium sp. MA284_MarDTE_T2]RCW43848.1 peptide/nickel transport system permease protein [Halanaerobium sp. MA284_MarDTE_T2]
MRNYILRRIIITIPLLFVISIMSFFIMQLSPGSYLDQIKMNPDISPELIETMEEDFGLDKSVPVQYLYWLKELLQGNLGESFTYRIPVAEIIGSRLLNTFILSAAAMIIAWGISIPVGVYSATHHYSILDNIFTTFSFIGLSIPNFFFALLLLFLIVRLNIPLPISGMTSIMYDYMTPVEKVIDIAKHLIVPAVVLGTASTASLMRQMRGQMLDVINQDYIRTARAKGLKERKVIYKHALKNALNPMITIFGFQLSSLFSGAALTEIVTGWPGLGNMMLTAVRSKDLYLAMAGMMMGSLMLIIGNLAADIMLALNDPRISYD